MTRMQITHKLIPVALCLAIGCAPTGPAIDSESAILSSLFPETIHTDVIVWPAALAAGRPGPAPVVKRIADAAGRSVGYAVRMQAVSRSGPFTILVVLDDELCVKHADVLQYGAQRGRQVRRPAFTRQFAGKCPSDPIRLGCDIHAATGATLSSEAMTQGVRAAIEGVEACKKQL